MRGLGGTGWFGWFKDDTIEQLTEEWLLATDDTAREALMDAIQAQAFREVPTVPLGQFQLYYAYRKNITGVVEAFGALM